MPRAAHLAGRRSNWHSARPFGHSGLRTYSRTKIRPAINVLSLSIVSTTDLHALANVHSKLKLKLSVSLVPVREYAT